jgi:dipeptidyl aminopeptidase/acylaminoacyl peptidase
VWEDSFQNGWNGALLAAQGMCVVMINMRGAKGYGQEFVDALGQNWGNAPYKDFMAGVQFSIEKYPFIDDQRLAVAGIGFGGFLVNWLATHSHPFQCLINQAGIFDPVSHYGTTDERQQQILEWNFKGTPYDALRNYEKWSPMKRVSEMKSPMLIIQGERDTQVHPSQSLGLFTALQKQKIPSQLLLFKDEGHAIKTLQNARMIHETMTNWIKRWTTIQNIL